MTQVPIITLNNGTKFPAFGLGTYASLGGDCERAVKDAIDAGYRHFDTAYFYDNEAEVGKGIKDKIAEGAIKREDVYIVTKLWCHFHDPERVEYACRKSLKNFSLEYVDAYLMHWPYGYVFEGDDVKFPTTATGEVALSDVDYVDTWKAMEKLVDLGLTKSIGVANFNSKQLERLLSVAKIKPVLNQVECHLGLSQKKLIKFCKEKNIVVTAYSPLGCPEPTKKHVNYLLDSNVKAIANKYGKTPAQIVLRYLVEIGTVPIPKSVAKDRIQQNIKIFDFKLNEEELELLDSLNTDDRLLPMDHASKSKFYPFGTD